VTADAYPTDTVSGQSGHAGHSGQLGTDTTGASVGQLMGEIAADLSSLMRQELELAKAELKAEAAKAGKGAGMLGGAAYAGHMVLLFGTLALVFGIGSLIGLGWAALIMTAVWAVVAAVLALRGRDQMRRVNAKPQRTIDSLKEDAQWARHPTS
jgi:Putative Actinobacterial Holin-X, holin superfamily III